MSKQKDGNPEYSREREWRVILDIQSQLRIFGESMQYMRDEFHDVRDRLDRLEDNVCEIKDKVNRLEEDVSEVKIKVTTIDSAFPRFFAQLSDHETRMIKLEKTR